MAPKKDAPPAAEEAPAAEEPQEKEIIEPKEGNFLLANGSTYKGQYNVIRKASPDTINAEVAGTALEPLVDSNGQPVVPTVEGDADGVPRRKGGELASEKKEIHGYGKLLFGPELFDGEWRKGEMIKGKHVFASGAVYEGFFLNNKFHGFGRYCWKDGREYEGFFCDGQMHGEGTYRHFTDGNPSHFTGISVHGQFKSGHAEQAAAKEQFLASYGAPFIESVRATLSAEGADHTHLLVAPGLEKEWVAGRTWEQVTSGPGEGAEEGEEKEEYDRLVAEAQKDFPELDHLLVGPCPASSDVALVEQICSNFGGETEPAITLVSAKPPQVRAPSMQYRGQCVSVSVPGVGSIVLCNVGASKGAFGDAAESVYDYDVSLACWRLVAVEKAEAEE
jgi:hypothetical protein